MNDELSIRIDGDKGLAPPVDLFAVRPDRKGPKTIAILLILGSLTMIFAAYGDISLANTEDLSQQN